GGTAAGGARGSSGFGNRGVGGMGNRSGTGNYGSSGFGTSPFGRTTPQATTQPGASGSFSDRLQRIINRAAVSGEIQVLGQTKIISDERTNSLLIYASREDMKVIEDIVAKLDVVLAQVLIEAVVISVSLNDTLDFVVSYLEGKPHGFNSFLGQGAINNQNILSPGNFNLLNSSTN